MRPLLCERHAHTTWSDGELALHELVDLYGRSGFDVLTVTDHVLRTDATAGGGAPPAGVHEANHAAYLAAVRSEAARARRSYDMVVIPGVELTYDDPSPRGRPTRSPSAARSSSRSTAASRPRSRGPATSAPRSSPHTPRRPTTAPAGCGGRSGSGASGTCSAGWSTATSSNGRDLFGWVADAGLPAVAGGDFHRPQHIGGWKTLVPCEKREDDLVA